MVSTYFRRQLIDTRLRGGTVLAIDGKMMRHAISAARGRGLYFVAAYLPQHGLVLAQLPVGNKENEIVVAPQLLEPLDLRGMVVTGDAMYTQRELVKQIVRQGGDFCFPVKLNQQELYSDIDFLFASYDGNIQQGRKTPEFSIARSVDKAHGRIEERIITVTSVLKTYVRFPHVEQVYRVERHTTKVASGEVRHEVVYGITSLPAAVADAARLLHIVREHWGIENGLHYRRDQTMDEDYCVTGSDDAARVMATLNNMVLNIVGHPPQGLAALRRVYGAYPARAVARLLAALILQKPFHIGCVTSYWVNVGAGGGPPW